MTLVPRESEIPAVDVEVLLQERTIHWTEENINTVLILT
jgi:hypothetical protein